MLTEAEKKELRKTINNNQHEIFILSLEEMDRVVRAKTRSNLLKQQWQKFKEKAEITANYYATGNDVFLLGKLMGDLGYAGTRVYVKYYGGKAHIILKGHPGLRKILNATKYGIQNPKVVKIGLGKYGAINAAKTGGLITIVLLTGYRVIDYFLTDTATLSQLVGTLATDIVKVGITTGASIAAAAAVSVLFTVAIGPLVAVIFVGLTVSFALTHVDEKYHITERVIAGLDELGENVQDMIEAKKRELVNKGNEAINKTIDSVIDYVLESAQQVIIDTLKHLFHKVTIPRLQ